MPNNSSYKDKDRIRKFEISPNQVQLESARPNLVQLESARPNLVQLELAQDRIKKYLKKKQFFQGFYLFFAPFFAVSWTKCIRLTLFAKRINPFDLL